MRTITLETFVTLAASIYSRGEYKDIADAFYAAKEMCKFCGVEFVGDRRLEDV